MIKKIISYLEKGLSFILKNAGNNMPECSGFGLYKLFFLLLISERKCGIGFFIELTESFESEELLSFFSFSFF
jgi:hypothetical protein